uniref:Uncharacterized protein n=1 Tax=Alexandrium catenella TaxID=2925 RepID=A0A7S1KWP6_ALECA|mmetsp:Transcript_101597/g.270185  ORF Transcript_101597/g.270185 Transcript_101597/m.270185 type:complete len:257 (+) Transcript_101597:59-829(+)
MEPEGSDQTRGWLGVQALECLRILEASQQDLAEAGSHDHPALLAWSDASMEAQGEARCAALAEKRNLGASMEELRATMRSVQEQCERCTVETRNTAAVEASARTLLASAHDELAKVHAQLRRSTQQAADHIEARRRLTQALGEFAEAFQGMIAQEVDAHGAIQHEVAQLQQVVRDLDTRLRSKSGEIDRLVRANTRASEEVTALIASWRREHDDCLASFKDSPLGTCTEFLGKLATRQPPEPVQQQPSKTGAAVQP